MSPQKKKSDWLNMNNPDQCSWCAHYLLKKNLLPPNQHQSYSPEQIKAQIDLWERNNTDYSLNIIRKMKGAWSQRKYHNKPGKKTYQLVMSTHIENKLALLAREVNMKPNEALEHLILGQYDAVRTDIKLEKEKKRKAKELMNLNSRPSHRI